MLENSSSAQTAEKRDISSAQISLTSLEYEIRGNKLYVGDKSLEEICGLHLNQDKIAPENRMDPLAIKQLLLMQDMLTSGKADMVCLPSPDDLYIYQREGNKVKLTSLRMPAEMQVKVMQGLGVEVKLIEGNLQVPFEAVMGRSGTKEINLHNIPAVLLSLTGIKYDFKDSFRVDDKIFQNESIKFKPDILPLPHKDNFQSTFSPYITAELNYVKNREVVTSEIRKDRAGYTSELSESSETVRFFHLKKNTEARESVSKNIYKTDEADIRRAPLSRSEDMSVLKAKKQKSSIHQGAFKPEREMLLADHALQPEKRMPQPIKITAAAVIKNPPVDSLHNFQNTGFKNPASSFTKIQSTPLVTSLKRGGHSPVSNIITVSSLSYIKKTIQQGNLEKQITAFSRKDRISSSFNREERKQKIHPAYLSRPKQRKSTQLRTLKVKAGNLASNVKSQQRVQIKSPVRSIIEKTLKTARVSILKIRNTSAKVLLYAKKLLPESLVFKISKNLRVVIKTVQRAAEYFKRNALVFAKPFRLLLATFRNLIHVFFKKSAKNISESAKQRDVFRLRKSVIKTRPAMSVRNFIRKRSKHKYLLLMKKIRRLQLIRRNVSADQEMLWYFMREAEKNKRKLRKIQFAERTKRAIRKPVQITLRNKI